MKRVSIDTAATYGIAVLAFALSYSKLVDLAERAGYGAIMSHAWPLIVDGLAILAARSVMRSRSQWYAWSLLVAGTAVSCAGAVAGAVLADGPLPPVAAAAVRFVPALCLPFALKLAEKVRHTEVSDDVAPAAQHVAPEVVEPEPVAPAAPPAAEPVAADPVALDIAPEERRDAALHLLATTDHSQRAVARMVGVAETTVRRWVKKADEQSQLVAVT